MYTGVVIQAMMEQSKLLAHMTLKKKLFFVCPHMWTAGTKGLKFFWEKTSNFQKNKFICQKTLKKYNFNLPPTVMNLAMRN